MSKIQVLALNDDYNPKCYVTRGTYYHDCADFVKDCLLKAHTVEYEVRDIYICDLPAALASMNEDEFMYIFNLLADEHAPDKLFQKNFIRWEEREKAFDLLWEYGETWNYA